MRAILPLLFLAATTLPAQTTLTPPSAEASQAPYTLRTESNVVLIPTTVQTKHGEVIYGLKANQFVVEDNGIPQTIRLDEDTDALGLSLAVVVQCSRAALMEYPKFAGLPAMIDGLAGGAPREVAVVKYGGLPVTLSEFSSDPDTIQQALSQLQPCDDDPEASTLDAVAFATRLLQARNNHYRHAILLIGETRDHGSDAKPAQIIAELGRTNTVVDAVSFNPGKTEIVNDLHYGGGSGPIGLLIMAVQALRRNVPKTLASLSGGEYINFTTQKGFDQGLGRLSNHLHNYYLLSFQPHSADGAPLPSGLHALRVKIPDYPDARLHFRESYFSGTLEQLPQPLPPDAQ